MSMGIYIFGAFVVVALVLAGVIGGPSRYHCPKCEAYWKQKDAEEKPPL